jgi:hypothetical protein
VIPVTAEGVLPLTLHTIERGRRGSCAGNAAMDATYFRDKAETCLRLAKGLSWNNPARGELIELAEEFQRQAEELDVATGAEQRRAR